MKKNAVFILIMVFTLTGVRLYAQHFRLLGNVNIDTGTVILLPVGEKSYYPGQHGEYTATIKQGRFVIEDTCLYPYQFRFFIRATPELVYVSDYFLVDPGTQEVSCQIDSSRKIPLIVNQSTTERKTMNAVLEKKKGTLLNYIIAHPGSYVAMWELVRKLSDGYDTSFHTMYSHFSPVIRHSYTGRVLQSRIALASTLAPGASFPLLSLMDTSNRPVNIQAGKTNRSKYTLVDFWFSHCPACIGQFVQLKQIYQQYQHRGFSVTAISIDSTALIPAWKSVIMQHQLPWTQYLDPGGKNAIRLSILGFPTNFLLDSNGVIIQRDIDLPDLDHLLNARLNG